MPVAAIRVASQVVIIGPLGYLEGGGFWLVGLLLFFLTTWKIVEGKV